ncbi:MAG: hypothetical protein OXD33_13250 [Rhodobacteraceae bacterium]|nr:hypothetical protein [Paracoccaceae bacterium]MCY4326558.1 hypothetical protein [Paracoccaceae bacterium]
MTEEPGLFAVRRHKETVPIFTVERCLNRAVHAKTIVPPQGTKTNNGIMG